MLETESRRTRNDQVNVDTALLTGFPGFIGRRLAAKLLGADPNLKIVALVEERMLETARSAAAAIDAARIELLPGNIAAPRLGLDDDAYERLRTGTASFSIWPRSTTSLYRSRSPSR